MCSPDEHDNPHIMNKISFLQTALPLKAVILLLLGCSSHTIKPSIPEEEEQETPRTEVVLIFSETPSGQREAGRMARGNRGPASDFTPTGFYVPPNAVLNLRVEQVAQGTGTPTLLIGSYSRYEAKWDPASIPLSYGDNTIRGDAHGGLLYVRYNAQDNAQATGQIRLTLNHGHKPHPYFVLGETTNQKWQTMLDDWHEAPDVVLINEGAIVVASMSKAVEYRNDDQELLLTLIDEALKAEYDISGLDGSAPEHQLNAHKLVMTETDKDDTFMAATWYRTWYHRDVVNHILTVAGFRDDGWGPWHELGHHHQQDAWTWDELGEVTVNIYSLAAERAMGIAPSRLVRDGVWNDVAAYLALPHSERDYNAPSTGVFVRLAMFQQLWLEYGDVFFQQLHKKTREDKPNVSERAEKMRYFMVQASQVAGNDLGPFFRAWGLRVDDAVYEEITALGLPQPTTDLTIRTDSPQ